MSHRVSFWGGLSLSLLTLGGCLLADVGIDPELDEPLEEPEMALGSAQGGGGGSVSSNGTGGSGPMPAAAGSGGGGGSGGTPPVVVVPPAGGSGGGTGTAGTSNMPPNMSMAGAGGGTGPTTAELAASMCPDNVDLETACGFYCDAYTTACGTFEPSTGPRPYDYLNSTDCALFCFSDSGWAVGSNSTLDSVKCRCFHSVLALTEGRTPHCFHAARVPTLGGCAPAEP